MLELFDGHTNPTNYLRTLEETQRCIDSAGVSDISTVVPLSLPIKLPEGVQMTEEVKKMFAANSARGSWE